MAKQVDDLIAQLDEDFESARDLAQSKANTAGDALVRQANREAALRGEGNREQQLREKYNFEAH